MIGLHTCMVDMGINPISLLISESFSSQSLISLTGKGRTSYYTSLTNGILEGPSKQEPDEAAYSRSERYAYRYRSLPVPSMDTAESSFYEVFRTTTGSFLVVCSGLLFNQLFDIRIEPHEIRERNQLLACFLWSPEQRSIKEAREEFTSYLTGFKNRLQRVKFKNGRRAKVKFHWEFSKATRENLPRNPKTKAPPVSLHVLEAMFKEEYRNIVRKLASRRMLEETEYLKVATSNDVKRSVTHELTRKGFLVRCRDSSKDMLFSFRTANKREFLAALGPGATCATCSRPYAKELVVPVVALSKLGEFVAASDNWNVVYAVEHLKALGVESKCIFDRIRISGRELDLVIKQWGQVLLAELKDKTFSELDAFNLLQKAEACDADLVAVLCTKEVSKEAQQLLERKPADRETHLLQRPGTTDYAFYENLSSPEKFRAAIEALLASHRKRIIDRLLEPVSAALHIDYPKVISELLTRG